VLTRPSWASHLLTTSSQLTKWRFESSLRNPFQEKQIPIIRETGLALRKREGTQDEHARILGIVEPVRSARREGGLLAPVEAKFLLAFDLDDAGILNDDFYRAESDRTQRAHDLTNSTSLVVVENFAPRTRHRCWSVSY